MLHWLISARPGLRRCGTLLAAIVALQGARAEPAADEGLLGYQCIVLGDARACTPALLPAATQVEARLEPGPQALYLMHLGTARDLAIDSARKAGEQATRRVVRVTHNTLSGEAAYRRAVGTGGGAGETIETLLPPR